MITHNSAQGNFEVEEEREQFFGSNLHIPWRGAKYEGVALEDEKVEDREVTSKMPSDTELFDEDIQTNPADNPAPNNAILMYENIPALVSSVLKIRSLSIVAMMANIAPAIAAFRGEEVMKSKVIVNGMAKVEDFYFHRVGSIVVYAVGVVLFRIVRVGFSWLASRGLLNGSPSPHKLVAPNLDKCRVHSISHRTK